MNAHLKDIVLGGGCFWGLQELFRKLPGVVKTEVGYAGGQNTQPTYENHPGHAEVVRIAYDTAQTSLAQILDYFFRVHDPTTLNRQGNDVGTSYRSVIFYQNEEEKRIAEEMIRTVDQSGRWKNSVVTQVLPLQNYASAEAYHQDYLQKNPGGYTCHQEYFDTPFAK